jgi:hypothetical protein
MDHHLEAYKLLADMLKHEEAAFWTRNQTYLTLNSGLVVILIGILTLLATRAGPTAPALPVTAQTGPTPPAGQAQGITIQQIVNHPAGTPSASLPKGLGVILVVVCLMGALLCFLWTVLIRRSQAMNDYLVAHMKHLENNHLSAIEIMRKYDLLFERDGGRWGPMKPVKFCQEEVRLSRWGSLIRIFQAWIVVATAFIILWIVFAACILFAPS